MNIKSKIDTFSISSSWLILISAIYIVTFDNFYFWLKFIPLTSGNIVDKAFVCFSFGMLFVFVLYIVISLFSIKYSTRYVIVFMLILSSVIGYFMDEYGTVISFSMVQNLMQTDANEAIDLASINLFFHVFLFGVAPSMAVYFVKLKPQSFSRELTNRLVMLSLVFVTTSTVVYFSVKDIAFIGRENREIRYYINPVYPIITAYKYVKASVKSDNKKLDVIFSDASVVPSTVNNGKKTVLVVVVGETARASSFYLNGYHINTTPLLNELPIINFPNTTSCGTATAESLPCMFSDVIHDDFNIDKIRHRENLLDALNYAGIDVLWRENNSGCKGVCNRSETQIMHLSVDSNLCNGDECFDEVLLNNLGDKIANAEKDTVIFLHQQGSHGPAYYKRMPDKFKKFKPECTSKALQECTNTEITNSYNNTILYTDYVLSQLIAILKSNSDTTNSAMIYMSDHGESLGEKGIYLHGLPYFMAPDEQTKIPFIVWLSSSIKETKSISDTCLKTNSQNEFSHDNLVHSVMGLMDITSNIYNKSLDVFANCRRDDSVRFVDHANNSEMDKI